MTLEQRFWEKVEMIPFHECWEWIGHVDAVYGYGRIVQDKKIGSNKLQAHRVSLMVHGIRLNPDLVVDHMCRNRACVNPHHLRQVSIRINTLENSHSLQAQNKKKSHCLRGHPFAIFGGLMKSRKGRYCKKCKQLSNGGSEDKI